MTHLRSKGYRLRSRKWGPAGRRGRGGWCFTRDIQFPGPNPENPPFWGLFHYFGTFSRISHVPARASQDQMASSCPQYLTSPQPRPPFIMIIIDRWWDWAGKSYVPGEALPPRPRRPAGPHLRDLSLYPFDRKCVIGQLRRRPCGATPGTSFAHPFWRGGPYNTL